MRGTETLMLQRMLIGIISDTHGLMRPEALAALRGCEIIVHAGDIGTREVLDALGAVAPVFAVRGNNDRGEWARGLPDTEIVTAADHTLYVLHDMQQLDVDPAAAQFSVVISGHSHQPRAERRGGVLYLNPGSAGPRRFNLPVAIAKLRLSDGAIEHELIELKLER
jgi:putative phosphoesterase